MLKKALRSIQYLMVPHSQLMLECQQVALVCHQGLRQHNHASLYSVAIAVNCVQNDPAEPWLIIHCRQYHAGSTSSTTFKTNVATWCFMQDDAPFGPAHDLPANHAWGLEFSIPIALIPSMLQCMLLTMSVSPELLSSWQRTCNKRLMMSSVYM